MFRPVYSRASRRRERHGTSDVVVHRRAERYLYLRS